MSRQLSLSLSFPGVFLNAVTANFHDSIWGQSRNQVGDSTRVSDGLGIFIIYLPSATRKKKSMSMR